MSNVLPAGETTSRESPWPTSMAVISAAPARSRGPAEKQLATDAIAKASNAATTTFFHLSAQMAITSVAAATAIAMAVGVATRQSPIAIQAGCQWANRSPAALVECRSNPHTAAHILALGIDK